jgi:hypothetical protein
LDWCNFFPETGPFQEMYVIINTNDFLDCFSFGFNFTKREIFEKIHTKSFKILIKKSVWLSCLAILSLGLKIEHSHWNFNDFFYKSKATHVRNAWKNYFFLVDLEFENF